MYFAPHFNYACIINNKKQPKKHHENRIYTCIVDGINL